MASIASTSGQQEGQLPAARWAIGVENRAEASLSRVCPLVEAMLAIALLAVPLIYLSKFIAALHRRSAAHGVEKDSRCNKQAK